MATLGVWRQTPDSTLWRGQKRGGERNGREQEEEGREREDGKAQKKVS